MIFSLLVLGAPTSTQSVHSALRFANAVVDSGNTLYRVFFYHDAIHNANSLRVSPQDEVDINESWQVLAKDHNIDLVICIASALKRGVIDETEAQRYEKMASNFSDSFNLSGLGQLIDATIVSDRVITFGP